MKSRAVIAVLGLAAAAFALPAAAQTRGGYIGFSAGQSSYKSFSGCTTPCDKEGRDYRIFGGFQLNRFLAAEAGYQDLGKATFGTTQLKAQAWDLSAVGTWGVPFTPGGMGLALLGRVGMYNGDLKGTTPSTGADVKSGTTDLTYGLGVQAQLSRVLGARVEWQRFSRMGGGGLGQKGDVDALTVGALLRF